jgi:hypothetical protein
VRHFRPLNPLLPDQPSRFFGSAKRPPFVRILTFPIPGFGRHHFTKN